MTFLLNLPKIGSLAALKMIDPVALSGKITYPSDATDELVDLWETQLAV
jgi:hypothetical protein